MNYSLFSPPLQEFWIMRPKPSKEVLAELAYMMKWNAK